MYVHVEKTDLGEKNNIVARYHLCSFFCYAKIFLALIVCALCRIALVSAYTKLFECHEIWSPQSAKNVCVRESVPLSDSHNVVPLGALCVHILSHNCALLFRSDVGTSIHAGLYECI